jgi:hypothetical protein
MGGGSVFAVAVSGSDLYAGDYFTTAGGKVSAYMAKALLNGPPIVMTNPTRLPNGSFRFAFTNTLGKSFSALAASNHLRLLATVWLPF